MTTYEVLSDFVTLNNIDDVGCKKGLSRLALVVSTNDVEVKIAETVLAVFTNALWLCINV